MRKSLYIYCLSVLAVVSCSKEPISEIDQNAGKIPLEFATTLTKGTPLYSEDELPDMNIVAYNSNFVAGDTPYLPMQPLKKKTSSVWEYTTTQYWPQTGRGLTFGAYSPAATADNGLTYIEPVDGFLGILNKSQYLHLSYTVPTDVTKHPDLMFSYASGNSSLDNVMYFDHALASISFSVIGASNVRVKSIEITNLANQGDVIYATKDIPDEYIYAGEFFWFGDVTTEDDELKGDVTISAPIKSGVVPDLYREQLVTPDNGFLMLPPQHIKAGSYTEQPFVDSEIIVTLTDAEGNNERVEIFEFPDMNWRYGHFWDSGVTYNYTINAYESVSLTFTAEPWKDGGEGELGDYWPSVS